MVFSSLNFMFRFLPVFLLIYFLVPGRFRNIVLLVGSLIFYGFGEPRYILLLIMSVLVNYFLARAMAANQHRNTLKKLFLILAVLYDVGTLLFFKYSNFIVSNVEMVSGKEFDFPRIMLPLGISFYTFQILSYVADVYCERIPCEMSLMQLGAYLCMFPKLLEGPIVPYSTIAEDLKPYRITVDCFEEGLRVFTLGLGSKILLANRFGQAWNSLAIVGYESLSTPTAWLGAGAYTLQIYFDFHGYSLMAIGLGQMLGFHLPANFNHPYTASSITDFWKRWHITLTDWFRTYIYIPLGGNRCGAVRMFFNMFIVWLLTGFWHGASWNFILWGLYHFVLLVLERLFLKSYLDRSKILSRIYTLIAVMCGWVIFAITDIREIGIYFSRMFTFHMGVDFKEPFVTYGLFFIPGILLSTPFFQKLYEKQKKSLAGTMILLVAFWVSVIVMVDSVYSPFLYLGF